MALNPSARPEWLPPMLCTLTDRHVQGDGWLIETKFDGVRCIASRLGGDVRLYSRNRHSFDETYPEIADALRREKPRDFIVDGEIVAFRGGLTSFMELQKRMKTARPSEELRRAVPVYYYLFDVLYFDGKLMTGLPLAERKKFLEKNFSFSLPLRYSEHLPAGNGAYYEAACRLHWEGVIAKKADSPYRHARSPSWLKIKCHSEQEFVIGGFTDPQRSRSSFGALLLGYHDGHDLRFAGKVGTGFDEDTLKALGRRLAMLQTPSSPFKESVRERGAHWVRPRLVAEVAFTEWTGDGKLRHPVFKGLRTDKPARAITREKAA